MKMVTKTGLVPVRFYKTGEVFGVKPDAARSMLAANEAELVLIPDDILTTTVADLPAPKADKTAAEEPETDTVEIPADWADLHHLQRVKLAKELVEDFSPPEGMKPLEYAMKIISEEVERRAAAAA